MYATVTNTHKPSAAVALLRHCRSDGRPHTNRQTVCDLVYSSCGAYSPVGSTDCAGACVCVCRMTWLRCLLDAARVHQLTDSGYAMPCFHCSVARWRHAKQYCCVRVCDRISILC
jgi:hypothetical protein